MAICSPDELAGVCDHLAQPVDDAISRDAERVARLALRAVGYDPDVDVTIAHCAGSTAVFLEIRGLADGIARAEAAGLVREAVRGREGLDGTVTVVMVPVS